MPAPLVAIVILNWNGRKFLQQFLPSVQASMDAGHELIVADNASTDDSISFLEREYPRVRILPLARNFGYAGGYNEALKQVDATYYVLLNSDVEVAKGWLQPMIKLLDNDSTIAACQPKIRSFAEPNRFEYAGAAGGWIDRYGYPFSKGRVFDHCEIDSGQYDMSEPIFWATGAALCIRSSVFHEMNGFDSYFFAHQEEIDLCWRIQLAGYRVFSCPASEVFHVGGGTLPSGDSKKTFLNFRNNQIMLAKNLSWAQKIWIIPARVALDAVTAWKELLGGDGGYFVAVVKAHLAFIKWILFRQRRSVFPLRRTGRPAGVFKGNVVWQYFVRKRKTFSEIVRKAG